MSACGSSGKDGDADGSVSARDPFEPQPDTSEGLTNVSADLEAVLEGGELEGACDRYAASPDDRRLELLCGKYLFFYGAFDQIGPPDVLFTTLLDNFPELTGPGFSNFGMIADPYSDKGLPLGFGYGADAGPNIPSVSYTCASCHFAQLPDGRYAVGAPNHRYEYGKQLMVMMVLFQLIGGDDPAEHHPDAVALVQPYLDRFNADSAVQTAVLTDLITLTGLESSAPGVTPEIEGWHANWRSGTMDAVLAPLYLDDGVHITTKIHSLWGLPSLAEAEDWGAAHVMIGWAGTGRDLYGFFQGFLQLGDAPTDIWTDDAMRPLEQYVLSLRAPANPTPPPEDEVARGKNLFTSAGCLDCHDGPRGMGKRVYTVDEIGTDPAVQFMMDKDLSGTFCCGYQPQPGEVPSHGIKSPRLVGLWTMSRFLHNGSIDTLDALLCLEPRRGITASPEGDYGHEFGCDLPEADRRALLAYLLTN